MARYLMHLLVPAALLAIVTLCGFIPLIGDFIQAAFAQIIGLLLFVGVGFYLAEEAKDKDLKGRIAIVMLGIAMCTLAQAAPHATKYFAMPFILSISEDLDITYDEARDAQREYLVAETGSGSMLAYAILSERDQLTGHSLGEFAAYQFDSVDSLGGVISAIINIVLHSIPLMMKWLLVIQLGIVDEPGVIGLVFWYLLSITIALSVYRAES